MPKPQSHVAVIGAGIGGLTTACRLAHRGVRVTVFERFGTPGGKMRQLPTAAGPVDAGPTVLTMKPVFDQLFADVGLRTEDVVTFERQDILARHFWRDGTTLDLMQDPQASVANVANAFGTQAVREFKEFSARAAMLFETFQGPMMQTAMPSLAQLTAIVAKQPSLIAAMDPLRSMGPSLTRQFSEPKLAQLFARYSTYVGGLPQASPALLNLISHAEAMGVWHVKGGMHALAQAIAKVAESFGAEFHYDADVTDIDRSTNRLTLDANSKTYAFDAIVFNGDPRALETGKLGKFSQSAVPTTATEPRSLSAHVMSFAATPAGPDLAAHNVFFAKGETEYDPLLKGEQQTDPTIYVCAQDRFTNPNPDGPERLEIILNSPATDASPAQAMKVKQQCHTLILQQLQAHGLTFSPTPTIEATTGPSDFDQLFPASMGSLYGRSPHGMMAAFKRPPARTKIPGLYLAGGGAHPGAGVPMAALSGQHAAEAILNDLSLTSTSHQAATHGGTSTVSATTAPAQSPSSAL